MANKPSSTMWVYGYKDGVYQPIEVPRPTSRPRDCCSSNEDLECLGCGKKLGCIEPGHCYLVEGQASLKK